MSGKNSIQVAIKVRPLLKKEKDQPFLWRIVDNSIQLIDSQTDPYYFDHIFDQNANNEIIFDKMAKQIVHSAIKGFNGTIFAYGQTSSGKTYTMMGDEDNPGVMVLAAKEIFKEIERTQDRQFLLRVGYIEIYNEKIYDLLNKKNQDLKIHETNTGIVSVNCEEIIIRSEDDLLYHLNNGGKERTVGETNMNERSSRSHAIFRIIIESRKMERSEDDAVIQSVINLVDLAGSERADQTGARGTRLKEGGHINKSLLFLSNVIKRLSENEEDKYISYRDSKLTRILQASLGGNALTAIICTIKPNALEETQSTLSFALRAKAIKNKPQVNEIVSDATMMKRLEHEIKVLKLRLQEEQRKNESQIKVRQLEQRIKNEDLKIISCNSLHSTRNREKRRRTWCPSSTNLDASAVGQQPSALPVPAMGSSSRLQQPKIGFNTPLITMRLPTEPPPLPPTDGLPEIDEEFTPAESVNFDMLSPLTTPKKQQFQRKVSITPKLLNCTRSTLEKVEHDLLELQSFTNLENKVEVHHEPDLALKQKVESLNQRIAVLENERLEYLQVKNDLEMTTENLNGAQKTCNELQEELSKLKNSNKTADEKIAKYEAELAELKKTNEKLEMENREAVNLEFEFKRHKNKSKLREHELLEALNDKEKEITKLEKSLNALSAERLQNSKEELLQKSLNEGKEVDEDGKVCIKCEDLQRLLDENKKITIEFEKLTLECEKLKLNYIEIEKENEANKLQIVHLEELQAKEKAESEKLLLDVQQLREKLQTVQHDYDLLSSENSLKHEECLELNRQVEVAKKEMVVLEEKFTKLELSWQEQQQTIKDIETQYATIQTKYENLQIQYEELEATRGQSSTDCQRLEKENLNLQTEIEDLKKKVNDAQQKLLENNAIYEKTAKETETANEEYSAKTAKVQQENEQLKIQLLEIQTQFEDLQKEYDDLSNQLMENIQDCEYFKNENSKLKEKLKDFEGSHIEVAKAEAEINELKSKLEKELLSERKILKTSSPICNASMRSSGVCVEEEEDFVHSPESQDLLAKFCELSESLSEIELEHTKGKTKLFKSASKNSTPKSYKMYLKNILGVHKTQKQFEMEIENIHLQGSFKQHSFHIVEVSDEKQPCEVDYNMMDTNDCENMAKYIEKLKEEMMELKTINEQERLSNKSLLESTERALSEMREQINQLSAELLEKSIFVENCSCKIYQQQIENLEKEKADITLICEELQDKVNSTLNGSYNVPMNNNTSIEAEIKTALNNKLTEIEELKLREKKLIESYDSQTKTLEEMTQRCIDMETELETTLEQLRTQEQEFKEKHNLLQLEILQKLELSANEHRDNMKKYNKEWEEKRIEYEQTIKELQNQIEFLKQTPIKTEDFKKPVKQDNISDSNEMPNKMQTLECVLEPPSEAYQRDTDFPEDIENIKQINNKLREENLSLQQQLNTAENLMMEMKEENRTRNQEITLLESKLVSLEELLTDAKLLHTATCRENASLKTEIENFEEDQNCIPELHNKNQQLSDEVERLTKEYSELQDKLQKAESKTFEVCKDFEKIQTKAGCLTSLEEEKQSFANDFENLKREHTQVQNKLHQAEVQIQELQTKLSNMTALESEKAKYIADFENLKQEYSKLQEKLQNTEAQIQEFCREQASREEQLQTLQTKLSNMTALESEKAKYEADFENLKQEYSKLQEKLQNTEAQIQEFCPEQASREELIQTLQTKLSNMTALESEKAKYITDFENLKQEYSKLQEKLQNTKEQIQEFCREQASREQLIQTLQTKLSNMTALESEKAKHETDFENLKQEYSKLQEKLQNTEEQMREFCREQASREQLIQTLQTKLSNMTALESEKAKHETDFENLKQEYSKLQEKLQNTEEQMQEFCREQASREEQLQTMQTKLSNMTALESEKAKYEADFENLKQEYSKLQEKLQNTEEQMEEFCREQASREELVQTTQTKLSSMTALESEKAKYEADFENLKQEYSKLQEKLQNTEEQMQEFCREQASREEQLQTMQTKLINMTALESEKAKYEADFENLKQEYSKLLEKLQNTDEQMKEFCREQASREEQLQTMQTKLSNMTALESEKAKYEADFENLKQEYPKLQEKLQNTEAQIQEFCREQASREELIQTLQTKLSSMTALESEKAKYEADFENLKQEYSKLQEKLQNTEEQMQAFCREQASREEQLRTMQTKLSNMTALEEEKGKIETDLKNLKEEYELLKDKLHKSEAQIKEFFREQASREELIQTLQTKLSNMADLEKEKENLETNFENLKQEYVLIQDKLHSAEEKIKEFCLEAESSKKHVETLQNKLCDVNALEEKNNNLEIESELLKKSLSSLQEKESKTSKDIGILKQENKSLTEKVSELINNETKLQSEKLRLEEKLRTISSEYSLLQTDKILLESQLSNLTEETKQLVEECSVLQEEKTTLTEQLRCLKEKERTEELLEQIINEKAELAQNLRLVTENLEVSQNKLKEKENQMARDKEKKLQIEQDLHSIKESLTQTIEEKHSKLKDLEREIKNIKQDNINLNQDLQAMKQSNDKAVEEKQELQEKTEELKKQLMKLKLEKQEKQLTLEKANQEYDKLQHDLKMLQESLLKVKEEKQQDLNNLEISYQNAQQQNKELQQKLKDLDADLITFKENQQKISKENNELQTELQDTKESLTKLNEEKQNLQEKLIHYQTLQEEKNNLEITLNVLKKTETGVLKNLQKENEQLQNTLLQYKEQKEEFKEKEETLKLKIESLSQQLHEMRGKAYSCEKLLLEHEELEGILTSTTAENQKLQQEISQLTSQQETCACQIENLTSEIEKLNSQLGILTHEKQMLQTELSHLKETLRGEQSSLQKEHNELKSSFEELKLKYDSLQVTNKQLENLNQQTQQQLSAAKEKLKEFNCIQEELNLLKTKHTELKFSLKTTVEEAERCSLALREDVNRHKQLLQQQLEKYNLLKVEMETKQDSLSRALSADIETLQNEKRSLEEKLRELTVRNFEQDLQRQAIDATANTSADSNTSHSPRGRKSFERLSIEKISNLEKLSAMQQKNSTTTERKNRRLNTHDERRRQSYWGASYDKETMTDPVDTTCNCVELDQKLKECERNLFIKTSQVTALSMELKNHPLKEETVNLKKRLQEEQNKHSIEIKRYKSKLYEQTAKAEKAVAAAAHATAVSTHAALATELQVVAPVLPKVVANAETQTDDELSACIQKLQGKYNDLKNICRHRYNVIKELEEKIAQKENSDGNSLSVLDSAQFKVMSNQCESLKREMAIMKEKYKLAKQVLQSRREEIAKLRAQLEKTE